MANKEFSKIDSLGRRRTPEQLRGLRRPENPVTASEKSAAMWIRAPREVWEWFASLPQAERGRILSEAREREQGS